MVSHVAIIIAVAAVMFLVMLGRVGRHANAGGCGPHHWGRHRCGHARPMGCGSVLVCFIVAGMILWFGYGMGRMSILAAFLAVGLVLFALTAAWGRWVALAGAIMLTFVCGLLALVLFFGSWVEHEHVSVQRQAEARRKAEIEARLRSIGERFRNPPPHVEEANHPIPAGSATLQVRLRSAALAEGNVTPDALAASILQLVDLLNAASLETPPERVDLSTIGRVPVDTRRRKAAKLSDVAHPMLTFATGSRDRTVGRIELIPSSKHRSGERTRLSAMADILAEVEQQRRSNHGQAGYRVYRENSQLEIFLEPARGVGIPVEVELAGSPAPRIAPLPSLPPSPGEVPLLPEAPPAAGEVEQKGIQPPVEPRPATEKASFGDVLLAYHLLMWTLPESLGGAAEFIVPPQATPGTSQTNAAEAAATAAQPAPTAQLEVEVETPAPQPSSADDAPIAATGGNSVASLAATSAGTTETKQQRPAWLDGPLQGLAADGTYVLRSSTERLHHTVDESHRAVADVVAQATHDYIRELLGAKAAERMSIPMSTILNHFLADTWDEFGPAPGPYSEPAWETHVLLKFDAADRRMIEQQWQQMVVAENLRYTGAGAGIVLGLLATVFGYLKLDTATRGYYSGRLKLAAGAVFAAIASLGIWLAEGALRL